MKLRWTLGILMAAVLAISAIAQTDHPQTPGTGDSTTAEPDNDPTITSSPTIQPQEALAVYEEQMAQVTVQTYEEMEQIVKALHDGQISSDQAAHLSRRCFELGVIRLQFLDTLHQIGETTISKEGAPAKPEEQPSRVQTSEQTLVVGPPVSSPDIPEAMAKYLELSPGQIAAIQARVNQEQRQVQPLLEQLTENRKALTNAAEMKGPGNGQIRKLAAEQSHILKELIVANSQLQRDIYQILTAPQRKKLDDMGQDTADVTKRLFAGSSGDTKVSRRSSQMDADQSLFGRELTRMRP